MALYIQKDNKLQNIAGYPVQSCNINENGHLVLQLYNNKEYDCGNVYGNLENYYTKEEVDELHKAINSFNISIVEALPAKGEKYTFYFIKKTNEKLQDSYDEYYDIAQNGTWEHLGSTDVDLSDYVKTETLNSMADKKVDKETGKGLSTNDFTTELKEKLEGLENYDDSEIKNSYPLIVPRTLKMTCINEDSIAGGKYFKLFKLTPQRNNSEIALNVKILGMYSGTDAIPYREYVGRMRKAGTAITIAKLQQVAGTTSVADDDLKIICTYEADTFAITCYAYIKNRYQGGYITADIVSNQMFYEKPIPTEEGYIEVFALPNYTLNDYITELPETETEFETVASVNEELKSSQLKPTVISLKDYEALTEKDKNVLYVVTEE